MIQQRWDVPLNMYVYTHYSLQSDCIMEIEVVHVHTSIILCVQPIAVFAFGYDHSW